MDFDSIIEKRKSVRDFTEDPVSWKDVLEAIDDANKSPFAGNHNNLKFIIIEDKEMIGQLAKLSNQLWIGASSLLIVVCSNDAHLERLYGERGRVYSRQQAGAAIQTLILKLTDLEIDSCWVGAYHDEIIKQKLKIPSHIQIEAIIATGYEDQTVKKSKVKKHGLEKVIAWERWDNSRRPAVFKEQRDRTSLLN